MCEWVPLCRGDRFYLLTILFPLVPRLLIMKDMVRRLQELRHTEQVQRAYALNCGEGATVSYEIQIRVLREFGLADAAAELLQVICGSDTWGGGQGQLCNANPSCYLLTGWLMKLPTVSVRFLACKVDCHNYARCCL